MRLLGLLLLPTALTLAAVDGTVRNGTLGKPQPGAVVTLYRLGDSGMQPLKSVKSDGEGKFRFEQDVPGPRLLQVIFAGVLYNRMITPGAPSSGLVVDVFESSSKPGDAKVIHHMVLFEPSGEQLQVSEVVIYRNDGKMSYNDPANGTLRIFLPGATGGQARLMATAPGGMPVQRPVQKTAQPGVYKIDFPIKPGETRFDITYSLPFTNPGTYAGKVLHPGGTVRLIAPAGVSLAGEGLKLLGQEPTNQASIYTIQGSEYKVEIQGTGALRAETGNEADSSPSAEQILPKIYSNVYWILGLSLAILVLGFILLYRRPAAGPAAQSPQPAIRRGKRAS